MADKFKLLTPVDAGQRGPTHLDRANEPGHTAVTGPASVDIPGEDATRIEPSGHEFMTHPAKKGR
jgi:hypothetical protein